MPLGVPSDCHISKRVFKSEEVKKNLSPTLTALITEVAEMGADCMSFKSTVLVEWRSNMEVIDAIPI